MVLEPPNPTLFPYTTLFRSTPSNDVALDIAYVADPWRGKLELIEWTGLWHSLPGDARAEGVNHVAFGDRKSTRLNSSHVENSYAVFCLKKKRDTSLPRP